MSNKASDNLHRLIKSLSKPEKRYFKVFSSRHVIGDRNNYQILFDAIDKQDIYDEEKLLNKFKNEAFIKRFSIAKSRLYNSVLKSLDSFHANSSIEAQLKRQIHSAEILYNKSLYDQSLKLLKSAKKVAIKHELTTTLMEIKKWEKRLIEKDNYEGVSSEKIEEILTGDNNLLKKVENFNTLWNIKSKLFQTLYVKGKVRSEKELLKFKKIIDEAAMNNKRDGMFAENEYLLNHIYSAYNYGIGNYKESYPHLMSNLELMETKMHLFKDEPNVYLSVLTNAMYLATKLGLNEDAYSHLEKLKKAPEQMELNMNEDREIRLFAITKAAELTLYNQSNEYDKGIELIPEIEEGLLKYEDKLSSVRKAFFYFNIATLHFGKGNMNESLKWINQLLNVIDIDKTQDIHCMAQLLNLVIHLELGNKSLLTYTMRSAQRYLETRNKVYRFETVFLQFLNEILKKRQSRPSHELYKNLATELRELEKDSFEKNVFEYFDFISWAESRAEKELEDNSSLVD